jgi:hypothetical protein
MRLLAEASTTLAQLKAASGCDGTDRASVHPADPSFRY